MTIASADETRDLQTGEARSFKHADATLWLSTYCSTNVASLSMASLLATFSHNLKTLRLEKGFTQEALAEACEFHRTYIGAMERGERNISLRNLEKLASILGVTAASLITARADD